MGRTLEMPVTKDELITGHAVEPVQLKSGKNSKWTGQCTCGYSYPLCQTEGRVRQLHVAHCDELRMGFPANY